jgi:hypothetical protein
MARSPGDQPVDANISEIVVVLDKAYEEKLAEAVEKLKSLGMEIYRADDENSVVEGQVETYKIHDMEKLDCVDYVRRVFSYDANYPPGDPRDRDGV